METLNEDDDPLGKKASKIKTTNILASTSLILLNFEQATYYYGII